VFVRTCVRKYACVDARVCLRVFVRTCVRKYACVDARVCVCVCLCARACVSMHV